MKLPLGVQLALCAALGCAAPPSTPAPGPAAQPRAGEAADRRAPNKLTAEGYGPSEREARDDALASLANSIFVQIESSAEAYRSDQGGDYFQTLTRSSTNLPMMGVRSDCREVKNDSSFCFVSFDMELALPLYREKLIRLQGEIDSQAEQLVETPKRDRYSLITGVLVLYDDYDRSLMIYSLIQAGSGGVAAPKTSRSELQRQLRVLEKKTASLELAGQLLARGISHEGVYVQPATPTESTEVTPFANALAEELKTNVAATAQLRRAKYLLGGSYQIHDSGIQVSYSLVDLEGRTLAINVVELAPESYASYRVEPQALDFDVLLHKGYVVSNDMRVELSTNKGSRQVSFSGGEEVELFVKLNRPGYYYVVGHIKNEESRELSYLLEANETVGNRRFVRYANADDANKWMSLGQFTVRPPYGVESLQIVASERDLIDSLPHYRYDPTTEYHVISDKITQGVSRVRQARGLQRPKGSTDATAAPVESAEAVLLFTTQK